MSVKANSLIDLTDFTEEERVLLGVPVVSDTLMETLIDQASDWIEHETQAAFIRRTITDEEIFPEAHARIYLHYRPVVSVTTIKDPQNVTYTDPTSVIKPIGIIVGSFMEGLDANGLPAPWKITYVAGSYENRAAVPPALKNACKQVLAWRWKVNANMESGGDRVPLMIKQSLTGFYSTTTVFG